jgi:tRNA1Val (adenine37-N6)-methyltransferase
MSVFRFKHFSLHQKNAILKVGTDALVLAALVKANNPKTLLDVGAGTGVVGLLCLQQFKEATGDFIEMQGAYKADFLKTVDQALFAQRTHFIQQDFLSFQTDKQYDLIVSNPPYYTNTLLGANDALNTAKHLQDLTLAQLLTKTQALLSERGTFYFIWPSETEEALMAEIAKSKMHLVQKTIVYGKPNRPVRLVLGLKKATELLREDTFLIRGNNNQYSDQYKEATREFHGVSL